MALVVVQQLNSGGLFGCADAGVVTRSRWRCNIIGTGAPPSLFLRNSQQWFPVYTILNTGRRAVGEGRV